MFQRLLVAFPVGVSHHDFYFLCFIAWFCREKEISILVSLATTFLHILFPDSGVGMALGYAEGKGIPYHRAIAKYTPTWPRSFTPSNQSMRSLVAKMKLIPNRAMLQGKRLLFCDDSIVRGTQLRDNVNILYDYGAKEVHMRIACPPLIYGCPFIGFTSSKGDMELITRRIIKEIEGDENAKLDKYATTDSPEYKELVERIRARFGLTSLKFNTLETLIEAIGLPKCKVCTHCFDGSSCF